MHQYSIDKKNRETVLYILVIISVALSLLLKTVLSSIFLQIAKMLNDTSWLTKPASFIQSTELIPNVIGVPAVYWALSTAFDKWIWKFRPVNILLGVPNLNGVWQGSLHSSYDDTDYKMELTIEQTWTKIRCISNFKSSRSFSNVAAIYSEGIEGDVLYFGFHNQSNNVETGNQQYDGYNILRLDGDRLTGKYFNDRASSKKASKGGNMGTIELKKTTTCKG